MAAKVIKIEIPIETQDKTDPALGSVTAKMEDLDNAAKNAQKSMDLSLIHISEPTRPY